MGCWMRKRVGKSSSGLTWSRATSRPVSLSNYSISFDVFFWLHVHEVEHCLCRHFTHINFVRFETMIWPRIEFKKSLDIFWPRLEKRRSQEYLDYFDRLWAFFLPRVHLEIQQLEHGENLQGFIPESGFSETRRKSARFYSWLRIFGDTSLSKDTYLRE